MDLLRAFPSIQKAQLSSPPSSSCSGGLLHESSSSLCGRRWWAGVPAGYRSFRSPSFVVPLRGWNSATCGGDIWPSFHCPMKIRA
jgi:hypothetical protein